MQYSYKYRIDPPEALSETQEICYYLSGDGRAVTQLFAEHRADVVIADIREEPREATIPTHELIENETDVRSAQHRM